MSRYFVKIFLAAAALVFLAGCVTRLPDEGRLPERIYIHFFYDEECFACGHGDELIALFYERAGDVADMYPYRLLLSNVATDAGRALFELTMASFGHSAENVTFPLMMVNSRLYQGHETIRRSIREAFLVAGADIFVNRFVFNPLEPQIPPAERFNVQPNENTIVYFYRIVCPACTDIEPFIDALPEVITVDGQDVPTNIIRLNTRSGNNGALIRAFITEYDVPNEDQFVPIIFLRDTHLTGSERIRAELLDLLEDGAGMDFEFPDF